jgi:signal transduction histidine kinase
MAGREGYATEGLELIDVGVAIFDKDTRLLFANQAFRTLRRYPDELCRDGVTLEALLRFNAERGDFGPGNVDDQIAERLVEIEQMREREIEREMADGQILRIRYRRTGSGGLVVTFEDCTAERQAQAELALSEERHTLAIQATSDFIYDWNVIDDVFYSSDNLTRDVDVDLAVEDTSAWNERIHADDYKRYTAAIRAYFRSETEAFECEYRVRDRGGDYLWVLDRAIGVRDQDGRVTRLVGAVRDISEFKQAKAELDRTEARLMSSLATIADGILLVDGDGRVQLWNDRYIEIFSEAVGGADVTEIIVKGRPFFDMIRDGYNMGMFKPHPDGADAWVAARMDAWEQPASQWELELANGAWLLLNERRMPDGGRVSVYTDITELKQREAEITGAKDAAEAALADLTKAQVRLVQAEKMASLGQLTAGIAHEIKNPLNFVNNFANLSDELLGELTKILEEPIKALDDETRDDAEDLLQTIRQNLTKINEHGKRADSIVKNMLLHSREGPSERQTTNLNTIAEEALNLAYHGARAENPNFSIDMVKTLTEDAGDVECFPQDLMRVFLNLINNGMYAAHKRRVIEGDGFEPVIWLTTHASGDQIEIEVRDNGSGIPAEVREKIFIPFFTTKPAGEGTGLGLSLSFDIVVKQHGGELTVESEPDEFTAFRVTLPRTLPASGGNGE